MSFIKNIILHPFAVALFLSLFLSGCFKKNGVGNSVGQPYGGGAHLNQSAENAGRDFIVNVGDRVFFELNSSSIEPDAERILRRQAEWLLRYPFYFITIEGHADERGTREYNLALGQRRAVAVRDYLISLGVSTQRIRTISYGKERPVVVCDDISCWNKNRRAVTRINN